MRAQGINKAFNGILSAKGYSLRQIYRNKTMSTEIGQKIPEFTLPATNNQQVTLSQLKGQKVVLYFYPKDSTPGCTTEGRDFSSLHTDFKAANTQIFGISRDSLKSHENFKSKQAFSFELISDEEEELCKIFDVLVKKPSGKMGIERSTYLLDENGAVQQIWRPVKVTGHAEAVLAAVKS